MNQSTQIKDARNKSLKALREALSAQHIDAWLQPINDEFQGEYVPEYAKRLPFISGFSGSSGLAIIPADGAFRPVLLVDGRYDVQAALEVDAKHWQVVNSSKVSPFEWIASHLKTGAVIACDAWLHTHAQGKKWAAQAQAGGFIFSAMQTNLIDNVWQNKPAAPTSDLMLLDEAIAGESQAAKIARITAWLDSHNLAAYVVTQPDAICWLLNLRASDIEYNPLLLSYALILRDGRVVLLTHTRDFSSEIRQYFVNNAIHCHTFSDWFYDDISIATYGLNNARIGIDETLSCHAWWLWAAQVGISLESLDDPIMLAKACKNPVEQQNMRIAHEKDAAALVRFLSKLPIGFPEDMPSEIALTHALEHERQKMPNYRGASFATIAGSGAHGAIVHYHATPLSDRTARAGELLLLDSGGQYIEGTTDITRTLPIGNAVSISPEIKDRYTRVLKGHIALASARFIRGTTGKQLDTLARQYLWQVGCDYDHGTGHGVGSFLCVHEGPQRISKKGSDVALDVGMVISNEPGYYKTGEYGIRIENLVLVVPTAQENVLAFETLTLVPIATSLLARELLSNDEIIWLNSYHKRVMQIIAPMLDDKSAHDWLTQACVAI